MQIQKKKKKPKKFMQQKTWKIEISKFIPEVQQSETQLAYDDDRFPAWIG